MLRAPRALRSLLIVGLLLWAVASIWGFLLADPIRLDMSVAQTGESLFHAVHSHESGAGRMPFWYLGHSLLLFHVDPSLIKIVKGALLAFELAVVFAIAGMLANPVSGLLAVALTPLLIMTSLSSSGSMHFLSYLFFPLTAAVMAWRAQTPTLGKTLVLGCVFGAGFLYRSTLAFLPPVIALYEWSRLYRFSLKAYWKHFLLLCLVPYLFLVPWMRLNWMLNRQVVPFENGSANFNISIAILGGRFAGSGESYEIVKGEPIAHWAFRKISSDPLRYARGFLERLAYAARLQPLLLILFALGLWFLRRADDFKQIGIFSAYFILIHCSMAVTDYYFAPLWPVLVAALAAMPPRLNSLSPGKRGAPGYRLSEFLMGAGVALAMVFGAISIYAIDGYIRRLRVRPPDSRMALADALARYPDDASLLYRRGKSRSAQGDLAGAAEDLSRACALRPEMLESSLELAWVFMRRGNPHPLLRGMPRHDHNISALVYKALGYLHLGRKREARERLIDARQIWLRDQGLFSGPDGEKTAQERSIEAALGRGGDAKFLRIVGTLLRHIPDDALRLIGLLQPSANGRSPALQALDYEGYLLHKISFLAQQDEDYPEELRILTQLTEFFPQEARFFKDRGICEYRSGLLKEAVESLTRAIMLDPKLLEARLSLGMVYGSRGRKTEAIRTYDQALSIRPMDEDDPIQRLIRKSRDEILSQDRREGSTPRFRHD